MTAIFDSIAQCMGVLRNVQVYCAMSKFKIDPYEINQKAFPQSEQEQGDHEHTKLKKPPLREGPNSNIKYNIKAKIKLHYSVYVLRIT